MLLPELRKYGLLGMVQKAHKPRHHSRRTEHNLSGYGLYLNLASWGSCLNIQTNYGHVMQEPNQTGTVLDNVVVSVKVKGKRITGLRECIELSYLHKQLPQVSYSPFSPPCNLMSFLLNEASLITNLLCAFRIWPASVSSGTLIKVPTLPLFLQYWEQTRTVHRKNGQALN